MHSLIDIERPAHRLVVDSPLVYCGRRTVIRIEVTAEGGDIGDAARALVHHMAIGIKPFDIVNLATGGRETIVASDVGYFADFELGKERLDSDKQFVNLHARPITSVAVGLGDKLESLAEDVILIGAILAVVLGLQAASHASAVLERPKAADDVVLILAGILAVTP